MQLDKVSLADTQTFSRFFLDYIEDKETLRSFYNRYPTIDNFPNQIQEKAANFPQSHRDSLVESLQEQYEGLTPPREVLENISLLRNEKTFTVTTGHQLNIFTGPLYFVYKIVTIINTCRVLKTRYPEYEFVPVFWMASEDHDYDEIKYFYLDSKKYEWETDQKGAVGRFNTKGLEKLADDVPGDLKIFREAYSKSKTLSHAVRQYVNALFGHEGLVVLDGDSRRLKKKFRDVMISDIVNQTNKPIVDNTNAGLDDLGYKTQVYCREINFFYLVDAVRSRIERRDDRYYVVDTDIAFSESEMRQIIDEEPEKLSPNVILRPLYQETILPNLAYVGGPAEVIYWLQLKGVFDKAGISFPIIMPRNFGLAVSHEINRKFLKTGLEIKDFFEEKNYLFNHWVLKHAKRDLTVGSERAALEKIFDDLGERASRLDKSLVPFVAAERQRALNSLEKIERNMIRAEKRLHDDKFRQIEHVKDALFPNGGLQERTENFLGFYQQDPHFIQKLLDNFDPFDFRVHVLRYDQV